MDLLYDDQVIQAFIDLRQDGESFSTAVGLLESDFTIYLLFELTQGFLRFNDCFEFLFVFCFTNQLLSYLFNLRLNERLNLRDLLEVKVEIIAKGPHLILPLLDSIKFAAKLRVALQHLV